MIRSDKRKTLILVVSLLTLSSCLYYSTITLFPSFIHAWTQSDRYAIALQFLNNGFDLFHPATFNLQTVDGITRVDFPVNEYIVALIMKITGSTAPVIFRLYTLFVSITGLVFLYKLSGKVTGSEIKSWLIVFFVFLSPVYVYYQIGFIPSVPAIAFVFIAYYYFISYKENKKTGQLLIAVLFFLLAALIRLPFIIFLFGAMLQQFWVMAKDLKVRKMEILSFITAFILLAFYYFYNVHLGRLYGSMFLDSVMPPKSFSEFKEIIAEMYHHWFPQYFTIWHYYLLLGVVIASIVSFSKRKHLIENDKGFWFNLLIVGTGTMLYFILMARQFFAHDYYFLDSLFVPFVLLFIFSIKNVAIETSNQKLIWSICAVLFCILFFIRSYKVQAERYSSGPWDRTEITHQNFNGSSKYLDSIGVPKNAKMLVVDAYTTNAPLILMNRKGYTVMGTTYKNIGTALQWSKWDYVVIQDVYLVSDVIKNYPPITSMLERIGGNGKISLYKKSSDAKPKTLKQFLGISPQSILHQTFMNFNSVFTDSVTSDTTIINNNAALDPGIEYGTTVEVKAQELENASNLKVLVNCDFFGEKKLDGIQLVAAITNSKETVSYQSFTLTEYFKPLPLWQKLEFQFVLPAFKTPEDQLKIYLWNPSKASLLYDNWSVIIYK